MKTDGEKTYIHNGKTVKIIPAKRVKKMEDESLARGSERSKSGGEKKTRKTDGEREGAKYAVGDKVSLKPIPIQYSGAGFGESVITKVFKSTHDQMYRYSIRSVSGHELALVREEELKPRKS